MSRAISREENSCEFCETRFYISCMYAIKECLNCRENWKTSKIHSHIAKKNIWLVLRSIGNRKSRIYAIFSEQLQTFNKEE